MIKFELDGIPIPWKRPGRNGKTGAVYDQQKLMKEQLRWRLRDHYKEAPMRGPLEVNFFFYMPMPKNSSKPKIRDMLNGVLHHIGRPDVDNLSKFYLDTMTGVIYGDDAQVCKMGVEKLYATEPYTLIEIKPRNYDVKKQEEFQKEAEEDEDYY